MIALAQLNNLKRPLEYLSIINSKYFIASTILL